jgi:hypothetical protein
MPMAIKKQILDKLKPATPEFYFDNIMRSIDVSKENMVEFNNGVEYLKRIAEIRKFNLDEVFPELLKLIDVN